MVEGRYSDQDKEIISHLLETPEQCVQRLKFSTDYCLLWKQITMDAKANVYLCQLIYEDRFIVGNYLEDSTKSLIKKIKTHPFCKPCMRVGAHAYQYLYADFYKYENPIQVANRRRFKHS
jgi:hypothetical protein